MLVVRGLEWLASGSGKYVLKVVLDDEARCVVQFVLHDEGILLKSRKLLKLFIISANYLLFRL